MALPRLTKEQIKEDAEQQLKNFKRTKDFLVAIDTDGCVTDNMNGKQMLIFHPQFMEFYGLWDIESFFREVAEYYNLFSVDRGCNRFIAIQLTLKALAERKDVQKALAERCVKLPDTKPLNDYISFAQKNKLGLGNPSLERFVNENPTCFPLYKLLGWSEAVNRTFPHISAKIPPFSGVKESLDLMAQHADVMVVSKTPYEDLANYWEAQGIASYVHIIAGQEMGSKAHHIEVAKKVGKYEDDHVLMIGDGKGDLKAVKKNNGLFYPVSPGSEQKAWNDFADAFEMFIQGKYKGEFEDDLLASFDKVLLTTPPWEKIGYDHINAYREKQEIRKALYDKFNPDGRLLIL
ncbi:HAD hydrolase-like protein [Candidatus Aerophobetes bacterium]|nr:HAD hydrolase-like protein [Candidatus Aerophobetes bacterium]